MLNSTSLESALEALGILCAERNLRYELVAVGGSGLLLLGLTIRPTQDLDIVAMVENGRYVKPTPLPAPLVEVIGQVAGVMGLSPSWINAGPAALLDFGLPEGFADRVETRDYGPITLRIASRGDQVALEVYAATDAGPDSKHFLDLRKLAPTEEELLGGGRWALGHDPSAGFRSQLVGCLADLGVHDADASL